MTYRITPFNGLSKTTLTKIREKNNYRKHQRQADVQRKIVHVLQNLQKKHKSGIIVQKERLNSVSYSLC
jgi:hypothetical protein